MYDTDLFSIYKFYTHNQDFIFLTLLARTLLSFKVYTLTLSNYETNFIQETNWWNYQKIA